MTLKYCNNTTFRPWINIKKYIIFTVQDVAGGVGFAHSETEVFVGELVVVSEVILVENFTDEVEFDSEIAVQVAEIDELLFDCVVALSEVLLQQGNCLVERKWVHQVDSQGGLLFELEYHLRGLHSKDEILFLRHVIDHDKDMEEEQNGQKGNSGNHIVIGGFFLSDDCTFFLFVLISLLGESGLGALWGQGVVFELLLVFGGEALDKALALFLDRGAGFARDFEEHLQNLWLFL